MAEANRKRIASLLATTDNAAESWREILRLIVEAVGAHSAILFSPGVGGLPLTPFALHNFDLNRLAPLFLQVSGIGPVLTQAIQDNLAPGAFADSDVTPFEAFSTTEYFQKVWAPMDWRDGLQFVVKPPGISGRMIVLNVRRVTSQGPFGPSEKRFANWLYPLFETAALRSFHIESAPALESPIAMALDGFSVGCILLDHEGQIAFANRAAQAIALLGDGVYFRDGVLHIADPAAGSAFAAEIARRATIGGREAGTREVVIPRRSGPPLLGLISFLPIEPAKDGAQTILYLVDMLRESATEKLERRARLLFGLTAAEANVLSLLLDGHDVDAIAERRSASALTVRTQLKVLMQKTGVRRQRDLIRVNRLTDFVS